MKQKLVSLVVVLVVLFANVVTPAVAAPAQQDDATIQASAPNLVTQVALAPATPNILKFGQNVTVRFSYNTTQAGGVRIFARPMTGSVLTPNYAACGSPIYPMGAGAGSCAFTITSGAVTVTGIRFQMWNAVQSVLLFQTILPVNYQYKTNSVDFSLVSQIGFTPLTPNVLLFNQRVGIRFSYNTAVSGGVRIFALPFTGTVPTPNFGVCPSPIYPVGSGVGSCFFTVSSGANTVTSVRFQIWDANQTKLLFQAFVPVDFKFRGGPTTLSLTTLAPRTPNILKFGQNVTVGFRYSTIAAGGVRIFARPFTGTALTPNYAACPSPIYPMGSGVGTCTFTITGGPTTVTSIRFQVWNATQTVLLFQIFEPVFYQFR